MIASNVHDDLQEIGTNAPQDLLIQVKLELKAHFSRPYISHILLPFDVAILKH